MVGVHGRGSDVIPEAYKFSAVSVLADIGGGNGSQIAAILPKHPGVKGILFDLPQVIEGARSSMESAGLADRCELIAGNFFESVPAGADTYIMRHILHDWNDEKCLTILRNCHRAMSSDSKLLIAESVIPPGNEPFLGKFLDLAMLLYVGGQERTEEEYRQLLGEAGFEVTRIVATSTEPSVMEVVKR